MTREILNPLLDVAREAGEAIMDVYRRPEIASESKADDSPVTIADLAAHDIIVDGLEELTPDLPVLSEESKPETYAGRRDWERFWLVDPLDGTKEFLKQNDEFTVNIGLIVNGRPALGVVYVPTTETMYWALDGGKACKQVGGQGPRTRISAERYGGDGPLKIAVSRSHLRDKTEKFIDKMRQKHDEVQLIRAGSSLKICMVAEGDAHIYPRLAPTMEWDTGAAHCVIRGAGGDIVSLESQNPLLYNKEELVNPEFIVQGADGIEPPLTL